MAFSMLTGFWYIVGSLMVLGIIIQAIRKIAEWRPSVNTRCVSWLGLRDPRGSYSHTFTTFCPFQRAEESRDRTRARRWIRPPRR